MNIRDKQDKRKIEEYKKSPIINLADSINRSMISDLGELTKGNRRTKIIATIIIIGIFFLLWYKSNL